MGIGLTSRDTVAVIEVAAELAQTRDLRKRRLLALRRTLELVGGEAAGFNLVDRRSGRAALEIVPNEFSDPSGALQAVLDHHPLIDHYMASGSTVPIRLSDVPGGGSVRELRRGPLYAELLRHVGLRQIALPVDVLAPFGGAACTVHRSGPDFTSRELVRGRALQVALVATLTAHRLADDLEDDPTAVPRRPHEAYEVTDRQWDVLFMLWRGARIEEVAARFTISPHTVTTHRRSAYARLGISNAREAGRWLSGILERAGVPLEDRIARALKR